MNLLKVAYDNYLGAISKLNVVTDYENIYGVTDTTSKHREAAQCRLSDAKGRLNKTINMYNDQLGISLSIEALKAIY